MQSIEWCHFQWPWTTHNPDFKGTPLFVVECLRNGASYYGCTAGYIREVQHENQYEEN